MRSNRLFLKPIAIGWLFLFSASGFAQESCKPLLPVAVSDLPCAANIIGGNAPDEINPPKAIEQARQVLWDQFKRGVPSFLNLEVASKEGARTRIVYVLEQSSDKKSLVLRWALQREIIDIKGHNAKWEPVENFRATSVIRDEAAGTLTFKNGANIVGHL